MSVLKNRFLLTIFFTLFTMQAFALSLDFKAPFVPLYSSHSYVYNDNFYTTSLVSSQEAINYYGYADTGVVGYLERTQQPNTKAFKRFYKGLPQTDHFYTTDDSEVATVLAFGWIYEGIEGYIYETQVPGSIPFYRINKWNDATGDLIHKYTQNWSEVQQLVSYGWQYDRIAGYIYATEFPSLNNGWFAGLRCPRTNGAPGCWNGAQPENYRDYFFPNMLVDNTTKTGTTQQLDFNFWTPDFFGDSGHLAFGLHGRFNVGEPDLLAACPPPQGNDSPSCTWYRGLGPIIYGVPAPICPPNNPNCGNVGSILSQVGSEAFWNLCNKVISPNTINGQLQNNRNYRMHISVSDGGVLDYWISDVALSQTVVASSWMASPAYPGYSPFPIDLTGFFLLHASDNTRDFTFYVTDMQLQWVSPNTSKK